MVVRAIVKSAEYHDSVSLMLAARQLASLEGVQDAAVVMATDANKSILADAGLMTGELRSAGKNDLVITVKAASAAIAASALNQAEALLKMKAGATTSGEYTPRTIRAAVASHPEVNMAVISVAGRYAADEAWNALERGLHVLLFSDNVALEDEIALKQYAREHGLLLMGPGAGTAIINHVALGFANVLPLGPVGIVSAAGTGLQEVSTLLARRGVGITQGIGTGGRDLKEQVGGIMMMQGIQALQEDPATRVLVLVSKPPAEVVVKSIMAQIAAGSKPAIVCFLGGDEGLLAGMPNLTPARTLQECALLAAQAVNPGLGEIRAFLEKESGKLASQAVEIRKKLKKKQRYLRGLFSGGTLCYEAQVIWKDLLTSPVYSNAPLPGGIALPDPTMSRQNSAVDLGEEEFTVGRPHPMIDNDLRIRRLFQEVRDPEVAVIMLDVVLGHGAHPDPASELAPAIRQAKELAKGELPVVASVTGTQLDPQCLDVQVRALQEAGALVCDSNAAAARLTGLIVTGGAA
jgi:FdrA protein